MVPTRLLSIRTTCRSPVRMKPAATLKAQIIISEIAGSESFIHVDCAGSRWVMLEHGIHDIEPDTAIELFVDTRHLMAFGTDGRAIGSHAAVPPFGRREEEHHGTHQSRPYPPRLRPEPEVAFGLFAEGSASRMERRRRLCAARSVRLRQDHAAEHHFRACCSHPRGRSCSTARTSPTCRRRTATSRRCSSFQSSTTR